MDRLRGGAGKSGKARPADSSLSDLHQETVQALARIDLRSVDVLARPIVEAASSGRWVYTFGNGGSAGLACHLATEFIHLARRKPYTVPVRVLSLSCNEILLTALTNDYGFEVVFEAQLRLLLKRGDVVLGISSSGKSQNVLRALRFSREIGALALGLTGSPTAPLVALCDKSFVVHSRSVFAVETAHLCFIHLLAVRVRELLVEEGRHV